MEIDPKIQKQILKGYERGETPVTCRPADILEPELEKAKEETKDIAKDIGDVLVYALYPTTGMRFLRWKYGLEQPPDDVKAKSLEDVKREDELIAKAKAGELVDKSEVKTSSVMSGIGFDIMVDGKSHRVELSLGSGPMLSSRPAQVQPANIPSDGGSEKAKEKVVAADNAIPVAAPMPGTILRYLVGEGDDVKPGDGIVVLEAMKMENVLPAPEGGKIVAINYSSGDKVNMDDVLALIG
jgi:biotin carboxyl carrier protein